MRNMVRRRERRGSDSTAALHHDQNSPTCFSVSSACASKFSILAVMEYRCRGRLVMISDPSATRLDAAVESHRRTYFYYSVAGGASDRII